MEVAKPKVVDVSAEVVGISEKELSIRVKNYAIFLKRGRNLQISIWCRDDEGKLSLLMRTSVKDPWDVSNLAIEDEELKEVISYYIANWDWFLEQQKAEIILKGNIKVIPSRVNDKEVLAYELAKEFINRFGAVGVYLESARGKTLAGVFCYEGGVYRVCEDWLKTQYIQFLEKPQQYRITKSVIDEVVMNRIPALNSIVVSSETVKPLIAFENGVFDWEVFIISGDVEKSIKPFDKSLFITHKIPHRISNFPKDVRSGLEKYIPPKDVREILTILRNVSPNAYNLLRSWAWFEGISEQLLTSRIGFLLEMIGRALLPGYRLFGDVVFKDIFVLLGPTNTGKTTFLISLLGNTILGERNYAVSKLSSFTTNDDEDIRRLFGSLFNVLAVFLPDISKREDVRNWSYIRSVSGGDPVEARRLRENMFWYYPAFKIYMASNDPPKISESGEAKKALLTRFKVIEFKNVFKNGELNLKNYLKDEDVEAIIICSLYAIRLVYYRKSYSDTGVIDVEDVWLRYSEPTYKVVMEMIEKGILALDPTLEMESGDLYRMVLDYLNEKVRKELGEDVDDEDVREAISKELPGDQTTFTKKIKELFGKYGVKTVSRHHKTVFKGLGIPRQYKLLSN